MFDLSRIDDRYSLEPPMRMCTDATSLGCWWKGRGAAIVQKEERRQFRSMLAIRKYAAYRKAVTDPMALVVALNKGKILHNCH